MKANVISSSWNSSPANSFRRRLQAELAARCARNPRYSLRAFAADLDIDHATLSQLIRGKRTLTERKIRELGETLRLSTDEIERYIVCETWNVTQRCSNLTAREVAKLAGDAAAIISEWHHYAILELTRLAEFKADSRWIGRVLGISPDEVNVALHRLLRLRLLTMSADGKWIDQTTQAAATLTDFAQVTVQRLLEQTRALLSDVIAAMPPESYDYTSTTLAIDSSRIPGAIAMISRLRQELLAYLGGSGTTDDVYRVELCFFPVTSLKMNEGDHDGMSRNAVADCHDGSGEVI